MVGAATLGAGGLFYGRGIEPDWMDVTRLDLTPPRLAARFDGYKIVQISDLHADEWMTPKRLSQAIQTVNDLNPDLVCITGDFVTSSQNGLPESSPKDLLPRLTATLKKLKSPDGVVAVLGNHDHWSGVDGVRRVVRESGITELGNGVRSIRRGDSELHLAGVDDVMEGRDRLGRVLDKLPASGAAVLLAHEPDFADTSAATGRFDLQLSGHSHGGQVRVPFLGAPVLPPLDRKYPLGLYEVGGMMQYTNRGLGMLPPRVRLGCRPEVTVFTLRAPGDR